MLRCKFGNAPHSAWDHCLMNPREAVRLVELCCKQTVIEIGSFRGGSAELIAPRCKHMTCIDPHKDIEWDDDDGKKLITKGEDLKAEFLYTIEPYASKVTYLQMYSDDAVPFCQKSDVVFIDGDHSYEQCKKDLENYAPKIRKIIIVHDYCTMFGGVIAACQQYFHRLPDELIDSMAVYYK